MFSSSHHQILVDLSLAGTGFGSTTNTNGGIFGAKPAAATTTSAFGTQLGGGTHLDLSQSISHLFFRQPQMGPLLRLTARPQNAKAQLALYPTINPYLPCLPTRPSHSKNYAFKITPPTVRPQVQVPLQQALEPRTIPAPLGKPLLQPQPSVALSVNPQRRVDLEPPTPREQLRLGAALARTQGRLARASLAPKTIPSSLRRVRLANPQLLLLLEVSAPGLELNNRRSNRLPASLGQLPQVPSGRIMLLNQEASDSVSFLNL